MSLPRYAEYKDSAIPWLGKIPEHWEVTKTKYVCSFSTGWTPPTGDTSSYEGENLWANISDLGAKTIIDTAKRISDAAALKSGIELSPEGSLLFSFKLSIGQVSFAGCDMFTNEAIATFRGSDELALPFAYYAFPLFLVQNASENIYGAKLLNQELIRGAAYALPPIEEQTAIAAFLDRETAKIDALIAEQEKLIALLAEKRQATISHAVTRGLNPNAPMKDSGVAWLGEVPAHWGKSQKLLDLVTNHQHSFVNGPFGSDLLTSELIGEGVPVVYIRDIKEAGYTRVSEWCVTHEKAAQLAFCNVLPGDVIVAKVGNPPGMAAVYPQNETPGIVTQDVIRMRFDSSQTQPEYMCWLLNSLYGQTAIEQISVESTRTRVGLGEYKKMRFYIPSLVEQMEISTYLKSSIGQLDALTKLAHDGIALLKERRSALISAAVTGQIDVRGLVEPQPT